MTNKLYKTQDKILEGVFLKIMPLLGGGEIILGGGTALSRFYLQHRVSYDLDFFLSSPFDPIVLHRRLQQAGLALEISAIESGGLLAAQLHGIFKDADGEQLNVSFVEDVFAGMFDTVTIQGVRTETIEGLYHRKLRTVAGTGISVSTAGHPLGMGHRQKARDLFDLYVLDTKTQPIERFIGNINRHGADFPVDIFRQNLGAIQWLELIDECPLLEILPPFEKIDTMDLKRHFDGVMMRLLQCDH